MNSNLDNDQLFNICAGLFKGFIEWIDVNSQNEKALILDSAYHFKNQILNQENPTLQKKYFQNPMSEKKRPAHHRSVHQTAGWRARQPNGSLGTGWQDLLKKCVFGCENENRRF